MATVSVKWQRLLVFPALIFVQCLFGGNSVVSKVALNDGVDPVVFGLLRDCVASPILMTAAILIEGRPRLNREDHFLVAVLGLLLYGNQLFYILGVHYTTSVTASLFQPSIPVFTALFALVFGIEVLAYRKLDGWLKVSGITISVTGAILANVLKEPSSDEASNIALGASCLVLNCVSFAFYSLLSKSVVSRYPPVRVAAWAYVGCTVFMLLSTIGNTDSPDRWQLPASAYWALAYTGILCSAVSYAIISWATKLTAPSVVTSFWPVQVFASAFLSSIFLDYQLVAADIIGAALISGGLILVIISKVLEDRRVRIEAAAQPYVPVDGAINSPIDGSEDDLLVDKSA